MPRNAVTIVQGRVYRVERVTRTYEGAEGRTFWCLSGDLATEQYATEAAALARFRRAERRLDMAVNAFEQEAC